MTKYLGVRDLAVQKSFRLYNPKICQVRGEWYLWCSDFLPRVVWWMESNVSETVLPPSSGLTSTPRRENPELFLALA